MSRDMSKMAVCILYLIIFTLFHNYVLCATNKTNINNIKCQNNLQSFNGAPIKKEEYCLDKPCIAKCCRGETRIMFGSKIKPVSLSCLEIEQINKLVKLNLTLDFSKIPVYQSSIDKQVVKTQKNVARDFHFILNKKMSLKKCASLIPDSPLKDFYILDNGTLHLQLPNFYNGFNVNWKMEDFCMDFLVTRSEEGVKGPFAVYKYVLMNEKDPNSDLEAVLKSIAMLVSCVCLLMVFFVYAALRDLRNLVGMVLMAYVATLATAFLFKCIELLGTRNQSIDLQICKHLSVFVYFLLLSSFFWMGVMSFDIWWTFRGILHSRPIHRRGELVKFFWYGLYAWGTPLLITIAVAIIDFSDLSHMPKFYKPHFEFCFYSGTEMRHYLYIPLLILLIGDWLFFLLTAFNIYRIRKNLAKFKNEASKYNNNQIRFWLYLKLSLVMGVSWVLEVVEIPTWMSWMENIAAAYNGLIGVAIFIIFVCKRKILYKLCKRFSIKNKYLENMQRKTSAVNSSQGSERRRSSEVTDTKPLT